jgi:hypothetical protein
LRCGIPSQTLKINRAASDSSDTAYIKLRNNMVANSHTFRALHRYSLLLPKVKGKLRNYAFDIPIKIPSLPKKIDDQLR